MLTWVFFYVQGALGAVLERSRQLCMHLYEKPLFISTGPSSTPNQVCRTCGVRLNQQQQAVFAALVRWRDVMCRQLDEGVGRMMPKAALVSLARELPNTAAQVKQLVKKHGASEFTQEVR